MIAVDSNLLIYSHRGETDFHEAAVAALTELAEGSEPWALPVFCITEFLRVVTHPRVFNPPSPTQAALDFISQVTSAPACRVVLPGDGYLEHLEAVVGQAQARGNLVFDAQIVALCREQGIPTILTNDRDFARFDNIEVRYLTTH